MDVAVNNLNLTKDEIIGKCFDFFGSVNSTKQTMIEIGIVFDNIIKLVYHPDKIHQIIDGPD